MKRISFSVLIVTLVFALIMSIGINSAIAAEKDKYGGTLTFNHSKTAGIIGDPLEIRGWNHEFIDFVLQPLLTPSNTELGSFSPNLATEWSLAPDRSHYMFKLRKGVKFHDGTDFNAQAAKWNLDRVIASKRASLDKITSIDVIDDYTIKANISQWDALTIFDFAKGTFIISPTAFEKNGAEWAKYNPVGTGAFKVTRYKRNTYIDYEKNDNYWKKGLPYIEKARATQIGDPMTAMAVLKRGDIDAWLGVDPSSANEAKKSGDFNLFTTRAVHNVLQFNSTDPTSIWSDKKVRQALEYAIDKEAIAKALGHGFLLPVYEVIHSVNNFGSGPGTTPRKYDPEKARQLLKEAGVPNGIKVKYSYTAGRGVGPDMAVAVQAMLAEVGIEIIPNPLAGAVMNQLSFEPPPPNMLLATGQRGGPGEFLPGIGSAFGEGTIYFPGMKKADGFNELLRKVMQLEDSNKQLDLIYKMERLAYEDCTLVAITESIFVTLQNPRVQDAIWFWAGAPHPYIEEAWLKK